MMTEVSELDSSLDCAVPERKKKRKRQLRLAFIGDVMGWLAMIAFFAGVFFAFKLCLEMGLHVVSLELKEHVWVNRGY
jgi:uncharacterized membrane protein